MTDNQNKPKPVSKVTVYPVQAAIWRNETAKGVFHSVTLSRTYRKEDGSYGDTNSFSGAELLQVGLCAQKAFDRAEKLTREARIAAGDQDGSDDNVTDYDNTPAGPAIDDEIPF